MHRIPTLTARIRLSSVWREKEEGLLECQASRRRSLRRPFQFTWLGTWTHKKSSCLSWCPSVHIRQRHTRMGMCLLGGHPSCVSYTLHGSSRSHTNELHDSGVLRMLLSRRQGGIDGLTGVHCHTLQGRCWEIGHVTSDGQSAGLMSKPVLDHQFHSSHQM